MEESGEVIQVCAKIFRFGMTPANQEKLKHEMGDLLGILEWVAREQGFSGEELVELGMAKQEKMKKWTTHQ